MKTFFQFGAAALALSASTAFAQAGQGPVGLPATVSGIFVPGFGATVTATVSGIFVPAHGGTFTLPASTPVVASPVIAGRNRVASAANATVNGVMSGSAQAVATFSAALTTAGIPSVAAARIARALTALQRRGSMTFGNVATAVTAWNAALASLTVDQLTILATSPEGRMAFARIAAARSDAERAAIARSR